MLQVLSDITVNLEEQGKFRLRMERLYAIIDGLEPVRDQLHSEIRHADPMLMTAESCGHLKEELKALLEDYRKYRQNYVDLCNELSFLEMESYKKFQVWCRCLTFLSASGVFVAGALLVSHVMY